MKTMRCWYKNIRYSSIFTFFIFFLIKILYDLYNVPVKA